MPLGAAVLSDIKAHWHFILFGVIFTVAQVGDHIVGRNMVFACFLPCIETLEKAGAPQVTNSDEDDCDELLMEAIELAVNMGQVSASMIQRKFKVGYARAGRIVDQMEERGIISGHEGSKPRQVLISKEEWEEMQEQGEESFDSASNE